MSSPQLPANAIVAAAVREQIVSGQLQPGDRTPSARELAREYGISPATAAKALSQLAAIGLVGARPGIGMIVLHGGPARLSAQDRLAVAHRTGTMNREGEQARRLSAGEEEAGAGVRAALQIDTARAFCRRRVRSDARGRATGHSASWFALEVAEHAPRLRELAPIDEGSLTYVQRATGRRLGATHEQMHARPAEPFDVQHGVANADAPVLVVEFVAYDADERPLTYEVAVYPERQRVSSGLSVAALEAPSP